MKSPMELIVNGVVEYEVLLFPNLTKIAKLENLLCPYSIVVRLNSKSI